MSSSGSPYRPPGAPVERPQDRPRGGIRWRALLAGAGTDLGLSVLAGIGVVIAVVASGTPITDVEPALEYGGGWAYWTGTGAGLACSVAGGYVAGRVAGFAPVKHGLLAILLLTIALVGPIEALDPGIEPLWLRVSSYAASLAAGALGGWLAR